MGWIDIVAVEVIVSVMCFVSFTIAQICYSISNIDSLALKSGIDKERALDNLRKMNTVCCLVFVVLLAVLNVILFRCSG